jgi:SAM-dependent methyltransferase
MDDSGNAEREFWERRAPAWDRRIEELNLFSDVYGRAAMDALGPQPGDRVLDIGCGPGTTAIQLAQRVGPDGEVLAVDIAAPMIAATRRRAEQAGCTNLRAETHDLGAEPLPGSFDAAYSRFGVMFFVDPVAAFNNLAGSLRPGARLGCTVWGPLGDNPWMFVPTLAATPVLGAELALPGPGEPGPFSLSDPDRVRSVLHAAGWSHIGVERVDSARVVSSARADDEVRSLLEVGPLGVAYDDADEATRRAAVAAVIDAIEPFREDGGWRLDGAALVVTATVTGD